MTTTSEVQIELIEAEEDFLQAFRVVASAFARQSRDGFWKALNPGWDTPDGEVAGARRFAARWRNTTRNRNGRPNTVFLKATTRDPSDESKTAIAGFAIWAQLSDVPGYGDAPVEDLGKVMDLEALHPGNEAEQRFLAQSDRAMHRRRCEVVREKATAAEHGTGNSSTLAIMALDICAVHEDFQRRGIAKKLVQWGLDEAERRGGLEVVLESTPAGSPVYTRMGFRPEGGEISFDVDEEFRGRETPSCIFMRTGPAQS